MTTNPQQLDEREARIVELLASGRSVAEAAVALGVSPTTIYRRAARPEVQAALAAARSEQLQPIASEIRAGVPDAVARLRHLSQNATHESTQVRASIALLELALKFDDHINVKSRLAALEAQLTAQQGEPDE